MKYEQIIVESGQQRENKEYNAWRTLYLLMGGTGLQVGLRLRKRILEAHGVAKLPFQEFLWLDTDRKALGGEKIREETPVMAERLALTPADIVDLQLPFERIRQYRDNPHLYPWLADWLSTDLLYNLSENARAEDGAARIRALGRLAFSAHFTEFRERYETKHHNLSLPTMNAECARYKYQVEPGTIEVVVVCSLAGGTGSGCFIEAARVIRELSKNVYITAYLTLPAVYRGRAKSEQEWQDMQANAFAALQELNALTTLRSGMAPPRLWIDRFRVDRPIGDPFKQIYLVDGMNDAGVALDEPRDEDAYAMVADALFFDFEQSQFGTKKRSHRCNLGPDLADTTLLCVPVQDGTRTSARESPRYVFRFPNAFGAFGLARIPFDRHRLRRAAGAWLADHLLELLIKPPPKPLERQEVRDVVVNPKIRQAGLSGDQVIERLLTDRLHGTTFDSAQAAVVRGELAQVRQQAEAHFNTPGLTPEERLERLRTADGFGRGVRDQVTQIIEKAQTRVKGLLSEAGARKNWGDHLQAVLEAQDIEYRDYQGTLRKFIVGLLAEPRSHGLQVAEQACDLLRGQLLQMEREDSPSPGALSAPDLRIDPGPGVQRAGAMRAQAEALFLPVYAGMARGYFHQQARDMLQRGEDVCTRQVRQLLDQTEERFRTWVGLEYRQVARSHGKRLFSRLAEFIGESGASSSDGQQVPLRPGIRTELRNFTEAIKESRGFFQGLYQSYSRPQRSGRNGDDLGDTQDPRAAVERALVGEAVTSQLFDDVLLSEWTKFFQDNVLGQQQGGDLFRGGLEDLLSRASLRQTNVQVWKELDARLETWAVERLDGYLADQDAIKLLTNRGEGPAMSQLQHVARSAYPWLCFDEAYDKPASLHPQALVGVQYEEAPIIKRFTGKQIEALWRIEPIRNDSGAIVVYAEKMAFPLYFVKALRDLHAGYEAVAKRDDLTILRRHTVANYLDLPVILPCDPEQAVQWFKMDRLVLEALLLNIFSPNAEGWVQYQYYEPSSHVRNTLRLPATLTAIAARLRREEHLEQVLRQAVHERTLTVFSQRELALRAISLADWTQNHAFPRREGESYVYLEHELAASITRLWRETAATRLDINPVDHPRLVEDEQKRLKSWAERSPISSRALASAEPCLLALPRETFDVVPAGGRQQG